MQHLRALSRAAKKDLSAPMANAYDPKEVESHWYQFWEES